jgi:Niemann-Pick C1 protein
MAVMLVSTYCIVNLGSCSPIHMRGCVAFTGLLTIGFSYTAGCGIAGTIGFNTAGVHNLLSFLLIGIGADDMFVICNALDQTNLNDPIEKRFKVAFANAGSSITITSFTNAISFIVGSTTPIIALGSFCIYAACAVIGLFFSVLTVFSCVLVWDTKRQINKKGDCCRLCFCKEDSVCCCRGQFLSLKQKEFSGILPAPEV